MFHQSLLSNVFIGRGKDRGVEVEMTGIDI